VTTVARPRVPAHLRQATFAADRHRCIFCGARTALQPDHIRPGSRGGRTAPWNLMTLCRMHNKIKSDYWPRCRYHPFPRHDDIRLAAAILAAELRHRRNPLRWVRLALAIANVG
jgi:5-methylcytosine-specific restriction endonuclease McrA